ncbi:MAG: hypothetical protein RR363_04065 [Rikenellaceae bacterium]
MSNTNIFEVAAREKMRFSFKGSISVEDLWDLSVGDLDKVFKSLNSQIKLMKEESLLNTKSQADKTIETQIEIVKHIVNTKLEEANLIIKQRELSEKKQKIFSVLSAKQDEDLLNKSSEELEEMLNNL